MNQRRIMPKIATATAIVALPLISSPAYPDYQTNPLSTQNVFYGSANQVNKELRVIDYDSLLKSTPEYREIKTKNLEPGTGKYWILMSQATDRIIKSINDYAQREGINCIARKSAVKSFKILPEEYKGKSLDEIIEAIDITSRIIETDKDLEYSTKD